MGGTKDGGHRRVGSSGGAEVMEGRGVGRVLVGLEVRAGARGGTVACP